MENKIIYLVHCVDTEGPMCETLQATFERLKVAFGIDLEPTLENINNLRRGIGIQEEIRDLVMDFVSPCRLNYKTSFAMLDEMLDEIMSTQWRGKFCDDFGESYKINWFIVDWVGFNVNPRRRAFGYHTLFNYYMDKISFHKNNEDEIQWHFHPVSFNREAHRTSNNFIYTNEHYQVLSRRVIDKLWFPSAYRPGAHCERPDINLFLEQWIPFDLGNQAVDQIKQSQVDSQKDQCSGRYGDWRRATTEWEIYNPDFYDYQIKGGMKRFMARCLNVNARLRSIDEDEIHKAFKRATTGKPTLMAYTNHDHKEMREDIESLYQMIRKVQKNYPEVKIKNSTVTGAFKEILHLKDKNPLRFDLSMIQNVINVKTSKSCWGSQPYFCFKTFGGEYLFENLDYHGGSDWSFTFDQDTIPLKQIELIGLAANDQEGNTSVATINPDSMEIERKYYP